MSGKRAQDSQDEHTPIKSHRVNEQLFLVTKRVKIEEFRWHDGLSIPFLLDEHVTDWYKLPAYHPIDRKIIEKQIQHGEVTKNICLIFTFVAKKNSYTGKFVPHGFATFKLVRFRAKINEHSSEDDNTPTRYRAIRINEDFTKPNFFPNTVALHHFYNGKLEGVQKIIIPGSEYVEEYHCTNGKRDGQSVIYNTFFRKLTGCDFLLMDDYSDLEQIITQNYRNGVLHGKCILYSIDNSPLQQSIMKCIANSRQKMMKCVQISKDISKDVSKDTFTKNCKYIQLCDQLWMILAQAYRVRNKKLIGKKKFVSFIYNDGIIEGLATQYYNDQIILSGIMKNNEIDGIIKFQTNQWIVHITFSNCVLISAKQKQRGKDGRWIPLIDYETGVYEVHDYVKQLHSRITCKNGEVTDALMITTSPIKYYLHVSLSKDGERIYEKLQQKYVV